jgi:hypothetical protein
MRAIATRDAGLVLASRIKRWLLAGALTLSGFFSLLAAHAFHGHLSGAGVQASSGTSGSGSVPATGGDEGGGGLQQPASAPATAPAAPAPVVSGGS